MLKQIIGRILGISKISVGCYACKSSSANKVRDKNMGIVIE